MDTLVGLLFFSLLVVGLFTLLRSHSRRDAKELWRLRRASLAQYWRLRIEGIPDRYGFDARRAEVVLDRVDIVRNRGGIANYCLVRYARASQ
jgi:hypothetical protein